MRYVASDPVALVAWNATEGWDGSGAYIIGVKLYEDNPFRPYYIGQSGSSVRRRARAFEHAVRHGDHRVPSALAIQSGRSFVDPAFEWAYRKGCTHGPRAGLDAEERARLAPHIELFLPTLHIVTIPTPAAEAERLERYLAAVCEGHIAEVATPTSHESVTIVCGPALAHLFPMA